jgi:transposase-like protein
MLSPNRDLIAAKHFLQLALHRTGHVRPRVINVDGHPAYAHGDLGIEAVGRVGTAVPLPAIALPK